MFVGEVKKQKARKDHQCMNCEGLIKKGDKYESTNICFDGRFYNFKTHPLCHRVACEWGENCDGMIDALHMHDTGDIYEMLMHVSREEGIKEDEMELFNRLIERTEPVPD